MNKNKLMIPLAIVIVLIACYAYFSTTFNAVRCEAAKHVEVSDKYADCVTCHAVATPKITQDWYESKHGIMLVKCAVCHGDPSGNGAVPFAANPDPIKVCGSCHAPAIERMQTKYGMAADCNACHPYHQNSIHRDAYENRTPTLKTTLN